MLKQKVIVGIVVLGSVGLAGCSKVETLNAKTNQEMAVLEKAYMEEAEIQGTGNFIGKPEEETSNGSSDEWEAAYRKILCDIESNLVDPYHFNSEYGSFNGDVYVGIHDFDKNDIPELIIGDSSSVSVFTYEKGKAERVTDLYETEEWGGFNFLCYKANHLLLTSCGNGGIDHLGGNGYVCFTFDKGEYITGFYCDYHPDEATINGNQVSAEAFQQQFDLTELRESSNIVYSRVNDKNEIALADNDGWIAIDDLDFSLIEW